MVDHPTLATQIEQAPGPSRDLDAEIARCEGWSRTLMKVAEKAPSQADAAAFAQAAATFALAAALRARSAAGRGE